MNQYVEKELNLISSHLNDDSKFKNASFLVTGGTGFIGMYLLYSLVKLNKERDLGMKIYATARNKAKAEALGLNVVNWIYCELQDDIADKLIDKVDYIIHTASPTDSEYFIKHPVELINDTIKGINNTLKVALESNSKGYVFLSSLEVYGLCNEDIFLKEDQYYSIDPTNVRNSYSEGKKLLECLLSSYASEYGANARIVRLGQTFGPGILRSDRRVFSQFANAVTDGKDIVLATKGETKRSYCSISDAILGIFTVLFNGKNSNAYNLASDNSYCSIYELAELFVEGTSSKIVIKEENNNKYLGTLKFGLDTTKIKEIGFRSVEGIKPLVKTFKEYFKSI